MSFFICIAGLFLQVVSGQYIEDKSSNDFITLTVEDGLSQNTVNCILKDKTGYLWFGTNSGINRYNGYEIEVLDEVENSSMSLVNMQILDLFEDSSGLIWIATHYGLFYYNINSERLFVEKSTERDIQPIHINCIEPESDSVFWLGTSDGLLLFKRGQGIIEEYRHKPYQSYTISNSVVLSLTHQGNQLWVGTDDGLNLFNKKDKSFLHLQLEKPIGQYKKETIIRSIKVSDAGDIWMGTEHKGVLKFTPSNNKFRWITSVNSQLPNDHIRELFITSDNDLLIATNGGGLCRMNMQNNEMSIIRHSIRNERSLSNNSVYSVLEDREGILWIGTYAGGVNFYNANNKVFSYIRQQHFDIDQLAGSRIRSVYLDQDKYLWLGTWNGVSVYNPNTQKFHSYETDNTPRGLKSNTTVTSIFQDSRGWMWIGTYTGGINLLKNKTGNFIHFKQDPQNYNSLSSNNVYCFAEDAQNNIWIGTSEGLCKYTPQSDRFETLLRDDVRDIKISKDGNIYLGIMGGVALFNPVSTFFKSYEKAEFDNFPVNEIYVENDSILWFATQGIGMGRLNLITNDYKLYHESDGLPSEYVSSITPIGDSVFWLSTFRGLSKFTIESEEFINFGLSDGLVCYEFYPRSAEILPDGQIAVGGARGLVFYDPTILPNNTETPKVLLTSLRINNSKVAIGEEGSVLRKSVSKTNKISLRNHQKDFTFDFISLNFNSPGENSYAYKLDNYIDKWIEIGNMRSIPFTNLNAGEYIFRVRNVSGGLLDSQQSEASMLVYIAPPFYYSWWFILAVIVFLSSIIYVYSRFRLISISQRKQLVLERLEYEKEKQFHQMRLRFFANISHEIRTPLSLIRGPLEALVSKKQEPENSRLLKLMAKNTQRLLRLVDQILDFRKIENDALKLQVIEVNIYNSLFSIYEAFVELAEQKKLKYKFITSFKEETGLLDNDKIEKILYNLLFNAFKFTPENGEVNISLTSTQKGFITIKVEDSGIGVKKEKINRIFERFYIDEGELNVGGTGIGLSLVKKLVELHHGVITVESERNVGTSFKIVLPINLESYSLEERKTRAEQTYVASSVKTYQDTPEELAAQGKSIGSKKPVVLVVEDETDLRNYIVTTLSDSYKVLSAENGKIGFELALKHKPELILSDSVMPVMDGIEFCEKIQANEKTNYIPFIFLSAWSSEQFKLRGLSSGAIDYIAKPFSNEELISKIQNIIDSRHRLESKSRKRVKVDPDNVNLVSADDEFIRKIQHVMERNMDNPEFSSKKFMQEMNMSHSLLYRKLKELTGFSSNEFIRDYRLKRAAQIISQNKGLSILEVGIRAGFNDPKYFSQRFKKKFGINPSEFANKSGEEQMQMLD